MSESLPRWMKEVTRLTRSGRLAEATQAIQQALGRRAVPMPAPAPVPLDAIDGCVAEVETDTAALARQAANLVARPVARGDGSTLTSQHSEAGLTRSYVLHLPPAASAEASVAAMPLVVMLHGCTQDPADFALGTGMNTLAREQGFAVLYPAQAQDANPQRCWNWFKHNHQQRGHGEAAVLAGMTRAVLAEHGLDARRVYVAGLSAGGAMAAILGQAYPDLYAAVGIHSGLASGAASDLMSALSAMKNGPKTPTSAPGPAHRGEPGHAAIDLGTGSAGPLPTIVFHGDGDVVVHPGNGTQAIAVAIGQALRGNGDAAISPQVEHGISAQGRRYTRTLHPRADGTPAQAEHWVVHGGGHAWSGGSIQGSYTDPNGPDATREMWRFFSLHARAEA